MTAMQKIFLELVFCYFIKILRNNLILLKDFHFLDLHPETNKIYKVR